MVGCSIFTHIETFKSVEHNEIAQSVDGKPACTRATPLGRLWGHWKSRENRAVPAISLTKRIYFVTHAQQTHTNRLLFLHHLLFRYSFWERNPLAYDVSLYGFGITLSGISNSLSLSHSLFQIYLENTMALFAFNLPFGFCYFALFRK